jgi:hypothetical protein
VGAAALEDLVGREGDDDPAYACVEACCGRARAAAVENCGHAGEEPAVQNLVHDQDLVAGVSGGPDASLTPPPRKSTRKGHGRIRRRPQV